MLLFSFAPVVFASGRMARVFPNTDSCQLWRGNCEMCLVLSTFHASGNITSILSQCLLMKQSIALSLSRSFFYSLACSEH